MNIVRSEPRERFAVIPNAALEDVALSWRARGLLAYLLSRPPGWVTDSVKLAALGAEGRDAVRSALGELVTAGYMRRMRTQNGQGKWRTDVVVFDHPEPVDNDGFSVTEDGKPGVGFPGVGSPGVTNKTDTKNLEATPVEDRPVGNARDQKPDAYINGAAAARRALLEAKERAS